MLTETNGVVGFVDVQTASFVLTCYVYAAWVDFWWLKESCKLYINSIYRPEGTRTSTFLSTEIIDSKFEKFDCNNYPFVSSLLYILSQVQD